MACAKSCFSNVVREHSSSFSWTPFLPADYHEIALSNVEVILATCTVRFSRSPIYSAEATREARAAIQPMALRK
ncbi:MAG TPA: hypothetical protein VGY58_05205 [Gemmataceae bacterium]|nr:hypothetical protein [Gemmataceae bacterium]